MHPRKFEKEESVMKNKNLSWFAALLVFALLLWCTAATPGKIADPSTYTSLVFSASTMAITGGSSEKMVLYTAQV